MVFAAVEETVPRAGAMIVVTKLGASEEAELFVRGNPHEVGQLVDAIMRTFGLTEGRAAA